MKAAIRAGYSENTAIVQASRLLTSANVSEAIANSFEKRVKRLEVFQNRVLTEYARLAFSDIRDYTTLGPGGVTVKSSDELTEDQSRAILEVTEIKYKDGGTTVRFKLHGPCTKSQFKTHGSTCADTVEDARQSRHLLQM